VANFVIEQILSPSQPKPMLKMKKAPMTFTAITGIAFMTAMTAQGAFVISQPSTNGISGAAGSGQTFTTNVGITPDPGLLTTIKLTSFSFWSSGAGNTPSDTTYLHIYDAKPTATTGTLVGVSTNFIDTNPVLTLGTQMTWTFNNLELGYGTKYWAVFANTTSKITSQVVALGFQNSNANPYAGGAALAANINENTAQDAKFEITFVPEPSTALLGALGMLALLRRRRA
jgi:hypothetical protein